MPSVETAVEKALKVHVGQLRRCALCPKMIRPVVTGNPIHSPIMLIGQAPGVKEGGAGKPFAWTAGKTLFRWFSGLGLPEEDFRARIYMAAVCRCFPGKNPKGGDRVPDPDEIKNCSRWLNREIEILNPQLIIPVGKLAIAQFLPVERLDAVVGAKHRVKIGEQKIDIIPLPHPSGASTWHRMEPGKTLLEESLRLIGRHAAFRRCVSAVKTE